MALSRDGAIRSVLTTLGCLAIAGCTLNPSRWMSHRVETPSPIKVPDAVAEFSENSLKDKPGDNQQVERNSSDKTIRPVEFVEPVATERDEVEVEIASRLDGEEQTPPDNAYDINFSTALALVGGENPRVGFAQARISEAFARLDAAEVLWLPSIRAGASYNKHEGRIQEVRGSVFDVSRASTYTGFGANAVGTGSPSVPGLWAQFHLADAIYQPIIAERTAAAEQHAATATTNDVLLEAALAYLELLRAIQQQSIAEETAGNTRKLVELTTAFARAGQGSQADADRALAEQSLRENGITRSGEEADVASFRLAEVLSLDAGLNMKPTEPTVTPIDLVPSDANLQELVATGLTNRPELSQSRLLVSEAVSRLKREKVAPLIPSVLLGLSYGGFGGGFNDNINNYKDRLDFDAVAFWEVRNLGFGERAARDEARARVCQARYREVQVMDRVAREVAEAHAQVQSRKKQIAIAESGIEAAKASYNRNLERIRQNEGLPIEALQSIQALDQARREYLRAVTDYNASQFLLYRSLGWPISQ